MIDEINFLIYNPDNVNIRLRGIGYIENSIPKYILYEDETGRFIDEIKNPFKNKKDKKLFDEMIKKYQSDNVQILKILKNNIEVLNYIIKKDGYNICIEPYDIFGLYS